MTPQDMIDAALFHGYEKWWHDSSHLEYVRYLGTVHTWRQAFCRRKADGNYDTFVLTFATGASQSAAVVTTLHRANLEALAERGIDPDPALIRTLRACT